MTSGHLQGGAMGLPGPVVSDTQLMAAEAAQPGPHCHEAGGEAGTRHSADR